MNWSKFIHYCLLLHLCSIALYAQNNANILNSEDSTYTSQNRIIDLLKHDAKYTLKGVAHSYTRPLHWKGKDFVKFGALIASTAALTTLDNETNRFFDRNSEGFPKAIRNFGWYFGSPQNYFIANAGLYGVGLFTKNEKLRKTSVLIISSSIANGFLQSLLKTGVGRARPNSGYTNYDFDLFSAEPAFHSFPSGHTALAITAAHAIAKQFDNTWVKIGIYTVGAIPPVSRLVDGAHWLTDITFSAALSVFIVDSIDAYLFKSKAYDDGTVKAPKKISWNFQMGVNSVGFIGVF